MHDSRNGPNERRRKGVIAAEGVTGMHRRRKDGVLILCDTLSKNYYVGGNDFILAVATHFMQKSKNFVLNMKRIGNMIVASACFK